MTLDTPLFVRVRGRIAGPFDLDQLQALARKGQLSRMHEVSTDQMSWTQAGSSHPEIWEGWTTKVEAPIESVAEQSVTEQSVTGQPGPEVDSGELIWHYTKNNEQQEPVSLEHLKKLFSLGELQAHDQVWTEGMSEWRSAADVPEFASCLNTPSPPPTSPPQPPQGMPYPPQGMPYPQQGMPYPQQGMPYPQQGMPYPQQGMPYPQQGMAYPQQPMQPQPIVIQASGANPVAEQQSTVSGGTIVAGYIFAFLFACVGFIIGLVVISKGEEGHGAAILILSIITMIISVIISANMGGF